MPLPATVEAGTPKAGEATQVGEAAPPEWLAQHLAGFHSSSSRTPARRAWSRIVCRTAWPAPRLGDPVVLDGDPVIVNSRLGRSDEPAPELIGRSR